MSTFTTLSQADEDDLHAKRLLNIEEKNYKRIQKRLLAPTNPIQTYLRRPTTATSPSDENTTSDADAEDTIQTSNDIPNGSSAAHFSSQESPETHLKTLQTFTHQTLHDFSALTTSLARLQFLLTSNISERDRYTSQTTTITSQHSEITSETAALRSRLDEARSRLEQRKQYDELAKKVLFVNGRDGVRSKTREELGRESERLRSEIEELEREGEELKGQWRERRETLGRVNGETERLRRVVRGEPEVVERDNDETRSDDGGEDEEQGEKRREEDEGNTHQHRHGDDHHDQDHDDEMLGVDGRDGGASNSNAGTPRPLDDAPTPVAVAVAGESGGMTPLPGGGLTPMSMGEHDHEHEGGFGSPRLGAGTGGSALKREVFNQGSSDVGGDTPMADQHDGAGVDVPEVRIEGESEEKGKTEGMDVS